MTQKPSRPGATPRAIRSGTLFALVLVQFLAAAYLVIRAFLFIVNPDPAVKAGPMYVTLGLCTVAAVLMLATGVNASFFRFMTRQQERDMRLVMLTAGATGIAVGVLSVGNAAQPVVMALFISALAFVFIWMQEARIDRAQRVGPQKAGLPPRAARSEPDDAGTKTRTSKSRQRRGGRKR